jgi:uncharacterized HAD superfamily protein
MPMPNLHGPIRSKLRIAVDLDGVLADTIASFCRIINERYLKQFEPASFTHWNAWEIAGITESEFFQTLDEAWSQWPALRPTEDDLCSKVERLRNCGKVDIVTGRSQETVSFAIRWLEEQRIPYDEFVRTESTRAKMKLKYDLFIDDSADLMRLIASRLDANGILYSQPWNMKTPDMPRIFRVARWEQILEIVPKLAATQQSM